MRLFSWFLIPAGLLLWTSCAHKVMPEGGTKDLLPPELVKAEPQQFATNFTGDRIEIRFSEYVQLVDITKQLVISPPVFPPPKVEIRKKSIWIMFKDTLAPNTTYNIQFGNAVADIHENTPLTGYRYVFSTGNTIDSGYVTGRIIDALTGMPVKDALAVLYKHDLPDSLVFKSQPGYFTRADSSGAFQLNNVQPGKYRITAIQDKNNNYLSDQPGEQVAFDSEAIELKDSLEVKLRLSEALAATLTIKTAWWESPGKLITLFTRAAPKAKSQFVSIMPKEVIIQQNTYSDTVIIWTIPGIAEPVDLVWENNGLFMDTISYQKQKQAREAVSKDQLHISGELFPPGNGRLPAEQSPSILFPAPILEFDSTKASVLRDSVSIPFSTIFSDSLRTRLVFSFEQTEGQYRISLLPKLVHDIYQRSNDSLQMNFFIPSERTTGSITLSFTTSNDNATLIQLVNEKGDVVAVRQNTGSLKTTFALLEPGKYRIRKINDENNNGRWDPGSFMEDIQPESVIYYRELITVRSNWEVELDWNE